MSREKIKKLIPYALILIILVGVIAFAPSTQASPANPDEPCRIDKGVYTNIPCVNSSGEKVTSATAPGGNSGSELLKQIGEACGFTNPVGCLLYLFYAVLVALPSFLLGYVAVFFNLMVSTTLSSDLYEADFIAKMWGIIKDFSNIFFILILLYAAFQTILGLGHGGAKKIIASVILIALVVNFSLFFTRVIVDASNILALIFYNKVATSEVTNTPIGTPTSVNQKDIAGAFAKQFNPNKFFNKGTFDKLNDYGIKYGVGNGVNNYVLISMITIYGIVIFVMIYALVVVGLSLLGRTLMLMTLMIVAPFAFVSYAIPAFKKIDTIGFDSWIHKLLESSFVAAILMFILYLISEVLSANIFGSTRPDDGVLAILVFTFLPGILITMLLLKGASYAKKASGEFTGAIISGAKVAGGLAVGGAALGSAALLRGTVGATAKFVQNDGARTKALNLKTSFKDAAPKGLNKANPLAWAGAGLKTGVNFATARAAQGLHNKGLGQKMKAAEEGYGHKEHASHTLDAKMQSEFGHYYGKDAKFKDLTEHEQTIVKAEVDKDEMAKAIYGKLFKDLEAPQAAEIKGRYSGTEYVNPVTGARVNPNGVQERAIENGHGLPKTVEATRIDPATGKRVGVAAGNQIASDSIVKMSETPAALGEFIRALRKGSYDIRNLPDMSAKSKGLGPKLTVGIAAGIAAGIRMGLKKGAGVENYGTPKKDFWKDIGDTISTSLKNAKITVAGGGHGGGDDHAKEVKSVGH